jgi:vitamin B12 transporter
VQKIFAQQTPILIEIRKNPSDVFSIKKNLKNKPFENLGNLLSQIQGININQNPEAVSSIFIRGSNSNQTLVKRDGIIMNNNNDPSGGLFANSLFNNDVKNVVVETTGSAKSGSGAIGGCVNVDTNQGKGSNQIIADTFWGSLDTLSYTLSTQGEKNNLDYFLKYKDFQTGGYCSCPVDKRKNDQFNQTNKSSLNDFSGNLGYNNENSRIGIIYNKTPSKAYYLNTYDANDPVEYYKYEQNFLKLSYKKKFSAKRNDEEFFDVAFASNQTKRSDHKKNSFLTRKIVCNSSQFYIKTKYLIKENSYGRLFNELECRHQDDLYENILQNNSYKNKINDFGFGLSNQTNINKIDLFYRLTNFKKNFHSYSANYTHFFPSRTEIGLGVKESIRCPNVFELYDKTCGNKNLKVEKSSGFEISFKQNFAKSLIGSTYFLQKTKDMIQGDPNNKSKYENLGKVGIYGLETFFQKQLNNKVSFRLEHTFLHAKDLQKSIQLKRRPMHTLGLKICYQEDNFFMSVSLKKHGKTADIDRFTGKDVYMKGFTTVNADLKYDFNKNCSLMFWVNNLLGKRYQSPSGYENPSTTFFMGLRIKI